jgi:hypothetical protein
MAGLDEYERKARLIPGLLAVLPVALVAVGLGWDKYPAVAVASGLVVGAGASYLLTVLVRHLGRRAEPKLWKSWGGPPASALLRLRTPVENDRVRDDWRDAVMTLTGVQLLNRADEIDRPEEADQLIESAVRQILHLGQRAEYPVLARENIQYGFERNVYGFRWIGRGLAAASVAVLVGVLAINPDAIGDVQVLATAVASALIVDLGFLAGWLVLPSSTRTRLAGERYAMALMQAVVVESKTTKEGR